MPTCRRTGSATRLRLAEDDGQERQHRDIYAIRYAGSNVFRKGELPPNPFAKSVGDRSFHPSNGRWACASARRFSVAAEEYKPNVLTDYLFELANTFSTFYEECPVLKAESAERRDSRLALCDLTARTLKFGLDLLGINVVERM